MASDREHMSPSLLPKVLIKYTDKVRTNTLLKDIILLTIDKHTGNS